MRIQRHISGAPEARKKRAHKYSNIFAALYHGTVRANLVSDLKKELEEAQAALMVKLSTVPSIEVAGTLIHFLCPEKISMDHDVST